MDLIAERLRAVLKVGARPAKLVSCLELLDLLVTSTTQSHADPYRRAIELARRLTEAADSLGNGAVGRSAQALFGTTTDTRGRLLKDRRRLAAAELDLMPSTFRRYYEDDLIEDLAVALWRSSDEPENSWPSSTDIG